MIVSPPDPSNDAYKSLLAGEVARALEFSDHAMNESSGLALRRMAIDWGIDPDVVGATGYEEEEGKGDG
jgi:hypothetical protein